jgi:hypothetical protein
MLGHQWASLLIPIDFSLHLSFGVFQYIKGIEVLHQLLEVGHKVSQMEEIPKIGMWFAGFNCGEAANFAIPCMAGCGKRSSRSTRSHELSSHALPTSNSFTCWPCLLHPGF